jgi:hypothetical protein
MIGALGGEYLWIVHQGDGLSGACSVSKYSATIASSQLQLSWRRTMAESPNYGKFRRAIKEEDADEAQAIFARHPNDPVGADIRKLWPHVLGRSPIPDSSPPQEKEVVLCYQYAGYSKEPIINDHANYPRKNLRCFNVETLENVSREDFDGGFTPKKFNFKKVKKQNCVEDVEFFR